MGTLPDHFLGPPHLSPAHIPDVRNSLLLLSRLLTASRSLSAADMLALQRTDPNLRNIIDDLENNQDFHLENNILVKHSVVNKVKLTLVAFPFRFVSILVAHLHSQQEMHLPANVLMDYVRNIIFISAKNSEIRQIFLYAESACIKCYLTANTGIKQYSLFTRSITNLTPGELINVDIISNLPPSIPANLTDVILLSDEASGHIFGLPLTSHLYVDILKEIEFFFSIIPLPRYLRFDFEPGFRAIADFATRMDITPTKSTPRSSNEAGQIEQGIGQISRAMKKITASADQQLRANWPTFLRQALYNINHRRPYNLYYTRQEMFYSPVHYFGLHRISYEDYHTAISSMLNNLHQIKAQRETQAKSKLKHPAITEFYLPMGTYVKVRTPDAQKTTLSQSKKLLNDFKNIFRVLSTRATNFRLQNIQDGSIKTIKKTQVVPLDENAYKALPELLSKNISPELLWLTNYTTRKHHKKDENIQFHNLQVLQSTRGHRATKPSTARKVRFSCCRTKYFNNWEAPKRVATAQEYKSPANLPDHPNRVRVLHPFMLIKYYNLPNSDIPLRSVYMSTEK